MTNKAQINFDALRKAMNANARDTADPVQKARMREAAKAIQDGRIKIPLACGWCHSPSIIHPQDVQEPQRIYECLTCGRRTTAVTAGKMRRQKIEAVIRKGIDVPGLLPPR